MGKRTTFARWSADGFESHIFHAIICILDLFYGMLIIYPQLLSSIAVKHDWLITVKYFCGMTHKPS